MFHAPGMFKNITGDSNLKTKAKTKNYSKILFTKCTVEELNGNI